MRIPIPIHPVPQGVRVSLAYVSALRTENVSKIRAKEFDLSIGDGHRSLTLASGAAPIEAAFSQRN
jgi:hypothetical protein